MFKLTRWSGLFFLRLLLAGFGVIAAAGNEVAFAANPDQAWPEVAKLVNDQKLAEAVSRLGDIHAKAKKSGDEPKMVLAFLRMQQLRIGLHQYESVVKAFQSEKRPADQLLNMRMSIFYAQALFNYFNAYQYEINTREKTDSGLPADLRLWTRDDINTGILKSLSQPWTMRSTLGSRRIKDFSDYITRNTFPDGVRDTMRDFATYLLVDVLAQTSLWTPTESNEKYKIGISKLTTDPAQAASDKTPDTTVTGNLHPLAKISILLRDLEKWHLAAGRGDAAMAARVHLFRINFEHIDRDREKVDLLKWLEGYLEQNRTLSWWTYGMATLAERKLLLEKRAEAHAISTACLKRFPQSVGHRTCAAIKHEIESPSLEMAIMKLDGPEQRSIQITHHNLPKVWFRAWPIDIRQELQSNNQEPAVLSRKKSERLLKSRPDQEWTVELPATPDFQQHRTYVVPPLKTTKPGAWMIAVSGKADFTESTNTLQTALYVVSDLVILKRSEAQSATNSKGGRNGVSAVIVSGATGVPLEGVKVDLYRYDWNKGHSLTQSVTTKPNGEASFRVTEFSDGGFFMIASRDTLRGPEVSPDPDSLYLYNTGRPIKRQKQLIYTDRAVYRPAQTINWKVLAYHETSSSGDEDSEDDISEDDGGVIGGSDGQALSLKIAPKSPLTVRLLDSNYEKVSELKVTTNSFGTAAGTFVLPSGRALGQWTIEVNQQSQASVRVEEYKRPTFEVELKEPKEPARLNHPFVLSGGAKFYFGQPVTEGTVKWTVRRSNVYPWWWDYYFGDLDYGFGRPSHRGSAAEIVSSGTSKLSSEGSFEIKFTPEADPEEEKNADIFYSYSISADVTDSGGETRSSSRQYKIGAVSVEAQISFATESGGSSSGSVLFPSAKSSMAPVITIRRSSLNGTPSPGSGKWKIFALKQPATPAMPADEPIIVPPTQDKSFRTPGDQLQPRWAAYPDLNRRLARWDDDQKKARPIASGSTRHDAKGMAEIATAELPSGAYRVRYETTDDFGSTVNAWNDFVVAGSKTSLQIPLIMSASGNTAKVGEKLTLLLGSAIKGQTIVFEKFRGSTLVSRELIKSETLALRQVQITEADRGGFSLVATMVHDHQIARNSAMIAVPWDNKELKVTFSTFRDKLTPGATETWKINVKGPDAAPKSAEILAFMYDRSLDLFGANQPPSPLNLYPMRYSSPQWSGNLGRAHVNHFGYPGLSGTPLSRPNLTGDLLTSVDGYGIGGFGSRNYYGRGGGRAVMGVRGFSSGAPEESAAMADGAEADGEADSMEDAAAPPAAMAPFAKNSIEGSRKKARPEEASASLAETSSVSGNPVTPPRQNFAETAFWMPQLLADKNGDVAIQFKLPDSVTSWRVFAQAITTDLHSGTIEKEARSVKDLMVRPYLPRFLREGDRGEIKVVINNASDSSLKGRLTAKIIDPVTEIDMSSLFKLSAETSDFSAPKNGSTTLTLSLVAPQTLVNAAFQITATAGNLSDGEIRSLPILPAKVRLMQSRFITLKDRESRSISFASDAAGTNPVTDQVVIGVDGQLFQTIIKSIPSLLRAPYECTDTIMGRYVATAITDRIYKKYPAVARAAEDFGKKRQTQLDPWKIDDPNRLMGLEETPWLQEAVGGARDKIDTPMDHMLLPSQVDALRRRALTELQALQTSSGGFPWFPGGPPSPYMTLLVIDGIARSAEFGAPIPEAMARKAWTYLGQYFHNDLEAGMGSKKRCCIESLTYFNYLVTSFPKAALVNRIISDALSKKILNHSFTYWRELSPRIKAYLIMTLQRHKRASDAKLVLESVMDSAKSEKDRGTWWAAEDRSWLWYNDTIESHALALRTLSDVMPAHPKRDGLITWLMLNKKLNQWKSTRATAEVIFSLARSLDVDKVLGQKEDFYVKTAVGKTAISFNPEKYEGQKQIVYKGAEAAKAAGASIEIGKSTKGLGFASASWHFATTVVPAKSKGDADFFGVTRTFYKRSVQGKEQGLTSLKSGDQIGVGDEIEVQLSISSRHEAEYVHLRDPRAAGFEPVNVTSGFNYGQGFGFGFGWYEEVRDSATNFFFERIPVGEFRFKYRLRATTAGVFSIGPATIQSMYAPEFGAYSSGWEFKITD